MVELVRVESTPAIDATYSGAYLTYWTTVEINAAISCACIMTLKPLVVHHFPRLLTPASYLRRYTRSGNSPSGGRPSTVASRRPSRLSLRYGSWISLHRRKDLARLPSLEDEKAGGYQGVRLVDVEAQRSDSTSSTPVEEDRSPVKTSLKSPPAAHLRLSIQVTKSIMVTSERLGSPSSSKRWFSPGVSGVGQSSPRNAGSSSDRSPHGSWGSEEKVGYAE